MEAFDKAAQVWLSYDHEVGSGKIAVLRGKLIITSSLATPEKPLLRRHPHLLEAFATS